MAKSNKPKLTINEQIVDMKKKNITFNIVNEQEAKNFLSHNNYYYKIKSYLRVFDKYGTGEKKVCTITLILHILKNYQL